MNQHDELIPMVEIAKRLGVKDSTARNWPERHYDFPEPVLWTLRSWPDVLKWYVGRSVD